MSGALLWFFAGLLFLAIDLLAPHLVLLFFGLGALAAALAHAVSLSTEWQILTFITVSIVSLLFFRRKFRRIFQGRMRGGESADVGEEPAHPLMGRRGCVRRLIDGGVAEVEISGSFWRAESPEPLSVGNRVVVTGVRAQDSLTLQVVRENGSPKGGSENACTP